jgi:processive 1,2-diacylglycerol beta-glucosyltransferase
MLYNEQPDLIVCTQAYPSFLVNKLKEQGKVSVPVVNVYTDFFINKVWGLDAIDFHFVPNTDSKQLLINSQGIPGNRIFVTGIPVDESFVPGDQKRRTTPPYHVLVSGGNGGLGDIFNLVQGIKSASKFRYFILCGNNNKLFHKIISWGFENVQPLSYMSSRKEMNALYDRADAIITKPGGVTVSEALAKKLPIFIHSALLGKKK